MIYKTLNRKDRLTRNSLKTVGKISYSGMISSFCSTSDACHVVLLLNDTKIMLYVYVLCIGPLSAILFQWITIDGKTKFKFESSSWIQYISTRDI
jgi:hypothetical protein